MDLFAAISDLVAVPGVTGNEHAVADVILTYFQKYTDDVWKDKLGNVYGRIGEKEKPVVLVMAHMDEIGLMVNFIEENGMLRLTNVGGVDPRVLPGAEVMIYGKEAIPGVVGAIPPHLHTGKQKAYGLEELVCDTGYSAEKVNELISVGDYVTFMPKPVLQLTEDYISSKTLDDRSLVAAMFLCMEMLSKVKLDCSVIFCASMQEERGGLGGTVAAYHTKPDMALVIDVTHGPTPGAQPFETYDMKKVVLTTGANVHPGIFGALQKAADDANIAYEIDAAIGHTGTDGWNVQVVGEGVPLGIVSPPLRYMHTSVEAFYLSTLENVAKVLAGMLKNIDESWEELLCWND